MLKTLITTLAAAAITTAATAAAPQDFVDPKFATFPDHRYQCQINDPGDHPYSYVMLFVSPQRREISYRKEDNDFTAKITTAAVVKDRIAILKFSDGGTMNFATYPISALIGRVAYACLYDGVIHIDEEETGPSPVR